MLQGFLGTSVVCSPVSDLYSTSCFLILLKWILKSHELRTSFFPGICRFCFCFLNLLLLAASVHRTSWRVKPEGPPQSLHLSLGTCNDFPPLCSCFETSHFYVVEGDLELSCSPSKCTNVLSVQVLSMS